MLLICVNHITKVVDKIYQLLNIVIHNRSLEQGRM